MFRLRPKRWQIVLVVFQLPANLLHSQAVPRDRANQWCPRSTPFLFPPKPRQIVLAVCRLPANPLQSNSPPLQTRRPHESPSSPEQDFLATICWLPSRQAETREPPAHVSHRALPSAAPESATHQNPRPAQSAQSLRGSPRPRTLRHRGYLFLLRRPRRRSAVCLFSRCRQPVCLFARRSELLCFFARRSELVFLFRPCSRESRPSPPFLISLPSRALRYRAHHLTGAHPLLQPRRRTNTASTSPLRANKSRTRSPGK